LKLKTVKIKNFRGYKNQIDIEFNELTAFIGKNDAGKSTILEALEIFFNNSLVSCEKEDLNINANNSDIEISCVFSDLPVNIVIDTSSETTLKNEFLLNDDNLLEVKKVYRINSSKPKAATYIVCNHPSALSYNDLLSRKITELREIANMFEIESGTYNASSSVSLRNTIWANAENLELKLQDLPVDKEDSKKIFASLEKYLPIYSLFQSDRPSKDNDKEVTDPMSLAIQQALQELTPEIEKIKDSIRTKAIETANRTLEKLKEMDKDLASSLYPDFKSEPKFDSLFKLSIKSDEGISINKRGSGFRRLILLNFFRAEAERKLQASDSQNVIYAFEEPETSQHPKHQEMLISSFLQLAYNTNSQVILTTHTPALAGLLPLDSLRFVTWEDGVKVIKQGSDDVYEGIAEALGVLAENINIQTKALLLLEGQGDVIFMRHLCETLKNGGVISSTLQEEGFAFIPTGGCGNLKSWRTLKLAEQFGLPWCVLQDSDFSGSPTSESQKNMETVDSLRSQGVKAYLTRKREPENYIHPDCFESPLDLSDYIDAKKEVNKKFPQIASSKVLEIYWPKMTFEQIRMMERYEDDQGVEKYEFTDMINDFLTLVK